MSTDGERFPINRAPQSPVVRADRKYLPANLTVVCRTMGKVSDSDCCCAGGCSPCQHSGCHSHRLYTASCSVHRCTLFHSVCVCACVRALVCVCVSLFTASRFKVVKNVHCVYCEVPIWKPHLGQGSCNVPTCTHVYLLSQNCLRL